MFIPKFYDSGKLTYKPAAASTTFVKGNGLKDSSGFLTNTTSGDNFDVRYIAMENKVTGGADGELLLVIEANGVRFDADTSNVPTQAQMNKYVDLSAAGTIDTSAVTDQIFYAEKIIGPAANKKVRGYFSLGAPNA